MIPRGHKQKNTDPLSIGKDSLRDSDSSHGDAESPGVGEVVELIERVRSHAPDVLSDIFCGEPTSAGRTDAVPLADDSQDPQSESALTASERASSESGEFQPVKIAHFQVQSHLGSGGSGVVFQALDTRLKRVVALKVPHAEALVTKRLRDRFLREAAAAAALDHRNIVPVYEAGTTNHVAYIAYAFCEGMTIEQWLAEVSSPLPGRLIARIVAGVAEGIQHAHGRGVLHRDIKPSNVMVRFFPNQEVMGAEPDVSNCELSCDPNATFEVRITDFGMARMQADDVETTRTGTILGTPAYMAPEQSRGVQVEVGPPADVYGLGGLLYELITQRPPFAADNVVDMLQAVRNQMPQSPSKFHPSVPRELETLTLRCLDKDPATRLPSAGFLAEELQRYLDGKPILSVPNSLPTALKKWARRHPTISSLTVALFLVGIVGALGIVWQWQNAERALASLTVVERERTKLLDEAEASLYRQQIGRIDRELAAGNVDQATQLLADCDTSQRGWEWNYLFRCGNRHERQFSDFDLYPISFDLNSDGTVLLTAEGRGNRPEFGGRWCQWNLETGELIREHLFAEGGLYGCAYSPDGSLFATTAQLPSGTTGHSVVLWDAKTGDELWRAGVTSIAISAAFSPDGRVIATAGGDGRVRIWDVGDGSLVKTLERHTDNVFSVAFHPERGLLVSASRDGSLRVWDLETGECKKELKLTSDLRCVCFDRTGARLAACGYRGCVQVLDVDDQFAVLSNLHPPHGEVDSISSAAYYQVDFSPVGSELLAITSEGVVEVWNLESGQKLMSHTLHNKHGSDCRWLDSDRFITASTAGRDLKIWNRKAFQVPRTAIPLGVNSASPQFSPDGAAVLVGVQANEARGGYVDTRLRLFDTRTMRTQQRFVGHEGWPKCNSYGEDGRLVASGDDLGVAIVWDVATGEQVCKYEHDGSEVLDVALVGNDLVTITADGTAHRWSLGSKASESKRQLFPTPITSAVVNSRGDSLLATDEQTLSLWSLKDGVSVHQIELPPEQDQPAKSKRAPAYIERWKLALDPTGRWMAAAKGVQILYWDRRHELGVTSSVQSIRANGGEISAIAFTHDGSRFASSHADSSVRIWDLVRSAEVLALHGSLSHRGAFSGLAFSRDDAFLIGGRTQMALWDATPEEAVSTDSSGR